VAWSAAAKRIAQTWDLKEVAIMAKKKNPGAERVGVPNNKVGAIKPGPKIEPVPKGFKK
jgi:hypothetical protein